MQLEITNVSSTCQGVDEFCRLHVKQIGRSVPGGRHCLLPPNQPVSGYDHSLVALKGRQWQPDGRTVTGHVRVHIRLIFIGALHLIFATYLLLMVRAEEKFPGNLESFLTRLHNRLLSLVFLGLGRHYDQHQHSVWQVSGARWLLINFTIIYLAKTHNQV